MNSKKFEDYTIKELINYCNKFSMCDRCQFKNNLCKIKGIYQFNAIKDKKINLRPKKQYPIMDETFYYINFFQMIVTDTIWKKSLCDIARFESNNCFKTKEEAEFRLEQTKVYNELKDFAFENNEVEIDWNNRVQEKWRIIYDFKAKDINVFKFYDSKDLGQIYFTSYQIALKAIEQVGAERIKKYLFEVKTL